MAEKIEYDIVVNGKKAKTSIEGVDKAQSELESNVKKSSASISVSWSKIGASIAAAGAIMGLAVNQASNLSKATFGLSDSMKSYITEVSNMSGLTQEMIAGFVQTGKSSDLADAEIKQMIDTAIALGRAYPHESIETFIDNLSMLNTSGEAQGFIVDILEKKWGNIDLKGKTLAEKMDLIQKATAGVNEEFEKTAGSKIDTVITKISNTFKSFGNSLLSVANNWGWLDAANDQLDKMLLGMKEINKYSLQDSKTAKTLQEERIKQLEAERSASIEILGLDFKRGEASKRAYDQEIASAKMRLNAINEQLKKMEELDAKEKENAENAAKRRAEQIEIERLIEEEKQKKLEAEKKATIEAEKALLDYLQTMEDADDYISRLEGSKIWTQDIVTRLQEVDDETKKVTDNISDYFDDTFAKNLADSLAEGKASFEDFANSVISDIARIIIQKNISDPLASSLGGFLDGIFSPDTFSASSSAGALGVGASYGAGLAQGGVFSEKRFASGGVVTRPTRFANGALVAERNRAEGILPLERTASGDLGVKANISSPQTQTKAEINFNVQAIDSNSFNSYLVNNKKTIEQIINSSLTTNGSVRRTIKQVG